MSKISQDQLKFILQRFDVYVNGANTKGAFLLAFNTFLCGGVLTNFKLLSGLVGPRLSLYLNIGLFVLIIAGILCLVIVLLAVYPFTESGNSSTEAYHSVIYFGSVSEFDSSEKFLTKLESDELDFEKDLSKQVYQLAKGLNSKYRKLEWATKLVFVQLLIVLAIVGLLISEGI
ncbi:hypothetical protein FPZ43_17475 [Mucilaginibacter pallidiroseus]|uniref:Pycsar effector protein domain-containing protein n=1 Tax=Mucilaginibacter pallidiroseus TaxID=2599295 RepID=A0A563U1I0_9SPHI|nr:Pycsar system effector family protein [Mucilaginibacter pallidiroseus]TWR25260.1 hypothetical protein FPZ43_17475 [Mucilaginibacter pallidiroseus]